MTPWACILPRAAQVCMLWVFAPCFSSSSRYHAVVCSARPGSAVVPHTTDSVRRVSAVVLVRWASLTALAHGPSASNRQSRPPRSMVCPEALKTYDAPLGASPTRNGGRARSTSTTLIGKPLCSDTTLHASTARLIADRALSATARIRYSEAGLLRPVGLKPP